MRARLLAVLALFGGACGRTDPAGPGSTGTKFADPRGIGPPSVDFPWHGSFSPDGRFVALSDGYGGYAEVWDVRTGTRAWPESGARSARPATHRTAFSRDGKRLAFVADGSLLLLAREGDRWREERRHALPVTPEISARWSPLRLDWTEDGAALLWTGRGAAWRTETAGGGTERLTEAPDDVVATFVLPGGSIAWSRSESGRTTVRAADATERTVPGLLLEASRDGRHALFAADPSRRDIDFVEKDRDSVLALEARDGVEGARRWETTLRGRRGDHAQHGHRLLLQAAWSSDGRRLATVEGLGPIVIRDALSGEPRQRIDAYASVPYPMGVDFSPDGRTLLTGGFPGNAFLWTRRDP